MNESSRDSEYEAVVVQPGSPEAGADPAAGSGFNLGLFSLMLAIIVLVCVQNVWLRRRAERENSEHGERANS